MQRSARIVLQSVLTAALVALFVPVGALATSQLVTLVDPDGTRAQVDGGELRVGDGAGALTVNGTVDTRADGTPFHRALIANAEGAGNFDTASYTVPAGKRLVVTHVSGIIQTGAAVQSLRLLTKLPGTNDFTATNLIATPIPGVPNQYVFSQPLDRAVPGGWTVRGNLYTISDGGEPHASLTFQVDGYLVG